MRSDKAGASTKMLMSDISPPVLFVMCQWWYHWGHISWRGWEAAKEEGWGHTEPLDTDRKDLWEQCEPHLQWNPMLRVRYSYFFLQFTEVMYILTNGQRLAGAMFPPKGWWLHVDEMEFMFGIVTIHKYSRWKMSSCSSWGPPELLNVKQRCVCILHFVYCIWCV